MKKSLLISVVIIVFLMSACIPSLHPLVQRDKAIIDDRIEGTWAMGSKIQVTFDGLTIESETEDINADSLEQAVREKLQSSFDAIKSIWTFGRAYNLTWFNPTDSSTVNKQPTRIAETPPGYEIMSKEALPYYILSHQEFEQNDTVYTEVQICLTKIAGALFMDFLPGAWDDPHWEGRFAVNFMRGHTFAKVEFENGNMTIHPLDGQYIEKLIKKKRIRLKHEVVEDNDIILTASTEELRAFVAKYVDDKSLYTDSEELLPITAQ